MNLYAATERLMGMSDAVWARHANPWSVWSRFTCLPLIILAIWSRVWIGGWAWVLLGAALVWTWANPRAFAPPASFDTWASRAVLGERVFLNVGRDQIPAHHLHATRMLSGVSAVGVLPLAWGLTTLDPTLTALGTVLTILPKVWFCDRMVWLYADMTGNRPGMELPGPVLPNIPNPENGDPR